MPTTTFALGLVLLPTLVGAVQHPAGHHHTKPAEKAKKAGMCANCPMCKMMMANEMSAADKTSKPEMKTGGMMGSMMSGMRSEGTALTVASDGTIYLVRGNTLYRFSADLKLLGSAPVPEAGSNAADHAEHEAHH